MASSKLKPLNHVNMNNYNTVVAQTPSNRATNPTLQKRRFMDCSNQSQSVNLHDHIANQSPDKTQAYVQKSQNYVEQHKLFNLQQMPDPQEDYNRSSAKKQYVKQNHSNRSSPQTSVKHQPKRLNGEAPQPKSNSQSSRKPGLKNAKSSDKKYKNIGNGSGRDEGSDNADELFITEYDGIQDDAIDKYLGNQFSSNQDIQQTDRLIKIQKVTQSPQTQKYASYQSKSHLRDSIKSNGKSIDSNHFETQTSPSKRHQLITDQLAFNKKLKDLEFVVNYVLQENSTDKNNQVSFKQLQRIFYHLGTFKYVGDISLNQTKINQILSREQSTHRLNQELLRMLFINTTQITGQFFLSLLSQLQAIKNQINQRQEWIVEKIETDEEFVDSNKPFNQRTQDLSNNGQNIDPNLVRSLIDQFVFLNDNEIGKFSVIDIKSKIQEQSIHDSLKECTFIPKLNQPIKLEIRLAILSSTKIRTTFLSLHKITARISSQVRNMNSKQKLPSNFNSNLNLQSGQLKNEQEEGMQSNRTNSQNSRYSRIQLNKYQEIIDRREQKKEEILQEMMQECTFKPILSHRSLNMAAAGAQSSRLRNSQSYETLNCTGKDMTTNNFEHTFNPDQTLIDRKIAQKSSQNVIDDCQDDLECTFKPKLNKQDGSKVPVWKQDTQKPQGYEKQIERFKKAKDMKDETNKIVQSLGKVQNYSGQPTVPQPFKFQERERSRSPLNFNLDDLSNISEIIEQRQRQKQQKQQQIFTFDIKLKKDKFIKLKITDNEDKRDAVSKFCNTYSLGIEREDIIQEEVRKYFERKHQQQKGGIFNDLSSRGAFSARDDLTQDKSIMEQEIPPSSQKNPLSYIIDEDDENDNFTHKFISQSRVSNSQQSLN
eukprot:403357467